MSLLTELLVLPFGLALDTINMVLWIVSSVCEATFTLIWNLTCFSMSTLEFILEHALTIVWQALFDWLPTLITFLYRIILYMAPIVWQYAVAISRIIVSAWMFVYSLPWRATFVSVISTLWDYTSSMASLFHRQGSYAVREVSNANYSAVWKLFTETYVFLLTVTFVGVVTCVLIWQNQQKNRSRRENPEVETREREHQSRRRSELAIVRRRRSHSISQSTSQENGQNGDLSDIICGGSSSSSDVDDTAIDGIYSNTELAHDTEYLRRRLHQANKELLQERDKFLCVVCQDLKREVTLKPCNHYCLCLECSKALRECPICKSRIRNTEKIYHA